jgi:putative DeoR family transcriptional regulator (stage III sporulation protein D)
LGNYIVERGATVREAAKKFGISKSTVHKDVTEELRRVDRPLYERVYEILQKNKEERHLRGGEATRLRYHAKRAMQYT